MISVLVKAVPRLCTIDWGSPKECIDLSTAEIVVWASVFVTRYTIRKQENASITNRQWTFRLLGGWRVSLWSMWIVRNEVVPVFHLQLHSCVFVSLCISGMWGSQQSVHISNQTYQASSRIVSHYYRFLNRPFRCNVQVWNMLGIVMKVGNFASFHRLIHQ